jgi:uncharacterized protein (TIRG00374 family)
MRFEMLKRRLPLVLKILVSVVLLLLVIIKADKTAIFAGLRSTNLLMFIISLFFSSLAILIRSYKWQLLLQVQGTTISLLTLQSLNYMALFFNNFFLGSLGGDAFKVYHMMVSPYSKAGVISSIVMERITGISMFFFVVFLSYIVAHFSGLSISLDNLFLPIFAINLLLLSMYSMPIKFFWKILGMGHKVPVLAKAIETTIYNIEIHKKHRNILLFCLLLSVLFYLLNIVAMYYCVLAANQAVDFLQLSIIVPIVLFITMIPISVNGLGVQESAFFYYFSQLGIDSSSSFTIAFLPRIGMYLFSLVGALLYFIQCLKREVLK